MFYIINKNKASSIIAGCHGHNHQVCPIDPETGLPNCENVEKHCKSKNKSSTQ